MRHQSTVHRNAIRLDRRFVVGILAIAFLLSFIGATSAAAPAHASSTSHCKKLPARGHTRAHHTRYAKAKVAQAKCVAAENAKAAAAKRAAAAKKAAAAAAAAKCPTAITGTFNPAPGDISPLGVAGTTTADLVQFATAYNAIRVAHCLAPIRTQNFKFKACAEARLFWMAEDPSTNPASAWGHTGSIKRSDGKPIVGCDGDIAGGMGDTGATVAQKWWDSIDHRDSLYQPDETSPVAKRCIYFAITHGGVPNEPVSFARAMAFEDVC
jgi:hypothetical protein